MIEAKKHITSIDDIINELGLFRRKKFYGLKNQDYVIQLFSIFSKFKEVKVVYYYKLNKSDFLFEKKGSSDKKYSAYIDSYFDYLLDKGVLAKSIQNTQSKIFPELPDSNYKDNVVIIPLTDNETVSELILILLNEHWQSEAKHNLLLCDFIANHFSNVLTVNSLNNNLKKINTEFEQKLSSKLLDHIKSKNDLNVFLDALQTGVFISSLKTGKIFRSNPVAVSMSGYNEFELAKMKIQDIIDTSNAISDENYETTLITKNQNQIPILRKSKIVLIRETEYQVDSILDITDIKNANETLLNLNKLLEEKVNKRTSELQKIIHKLNVEIENRIEAQRIADEERSMSKVKSKFIATVSHEFRTPLTIIRSSADLLKQYDDKLKPEDKQKYLLRIVQTSDYLSQVLQNILFIQDMDNTMIGSTNAHFDLIQLIKDLINYINQTKTQNFEIKLNSNEDKIIINKSDGLIKAIFNNILTNSISYNKDNNPIEIDVNETEELINIKISDKGIGIPDKDLSHIFEMFYRGSNVFHIPGAGLGLSMVEHSINLLGGKINITSSENIGTEVVIEISKNN